MNSDVKILSIKNLEVSFSASENPVRALRGLNLTVQRGEVHALVGESGSGKTVTAMSILGLLQTPPAELRRGSILLGEKEIVGKTERELQHIRGNLVGMIFQEPSRYLNPAFRVSEQVIEMLCHHLGLSKKTAAKKAADLFSLVGLGESRRLLRSYPHELSGGMRQRAMIAMAVSCQPDLLVADEPTTALDVTVQRRILALLRTLNSSLDMSILFISHDMGAVHEVADTVSVLYSGKIVESSARKELFQNPKHPYTRLLLAAIPDPEKRGQRLQTIPGRVPDAAKIPSGCSFHTRCPYAFSQCSVTVPEFREYTAKHFTACHLLESSHDR